MSLPDLICRDVDLLKQIDAQAILPEYLQSKLGNGVFVTFSFSTIKDEICGIFEPGATKPQDRLRALRSVSESGLLTGISMMPLLPYISDTEDEMMNMVEAFKENGASYIMPASLTLFGEGTSDSKSLMLHAIEKYYPELKPKYDALYGEGFRPSWSYAKTVEERAKGLIEKSGLRTTIMK